MKATPSKLPPDVAAYLISAAVEIATEQGFNPSNEAALGSWMEVNRREVGARALQKMKDLREALYDNVELRKEVVSMLSLSVYNSIRGDGPQPPAWNHRYVAYALEHSCTPDEMLKRDKGSMVGFLCWKPKTQTA